MIILQSRDKVQILVESTEQICPVALHLFWILSPGFENNHTLKCWSGIFPTIVTYVIMLEKLPEQHFSLWLFFNPGDKMLFLLKFNEARISEWNINKVFRGYFFQIMYIYLLFQNYGIWSELKGCQIYTLFA